MLGARYNQYHPEGHGQEPLGGWEETGHLYFGLVLFFSCVDWDLFYYIR